MHRGSDRPTSRKQPLRDRSDLGFSEAAQHAFRFLSEYGFQLISSGPTIIRYKSARAFFNAYHGLLSYELGIEVGPADRDGEATSGYSLSELARLMSPEEAKAFRYFIATTRELVKSGLRELVNLVRRYGESALRGDAAAFAALERQRRKRAEGYAAEVLAEEVRPKAEEAIRERNYEKAALLYELIRGKLTPAELKKLEYAKQHARR